MEQQTAVNFLINYMFENFYLTDEALQKFDEAKKMEKEQIVKAWKSRVQYLPEPIGVSIIAISGEEYYEKTYKNEHDLY